MKKDAVYDFSSSNLKKTVRGGNGEQQFGHFNDDGTEYIINTADTPRPWLNYLGNDSYGLVFGNRGEGFSWYKSMLARVTKYTTTEYVPREPDAGRNIFIRDNDLAKSGSMVAADDDHSYSCTHGLGYTLLHRSLFGIDCNWKIFVPIGDPVELWELRLENKNAVTKSISIFSFLQWHLSQYLFSPPVVYSPASDYKVDISAQFYSEANAVVASNSNREQPLRFGGFFAADAEIDSYDCSKSDFIGDGCEDVPGAVASGCCSNSSAVNREAIAALCISVCLKPGETKTVRFVGGVLEDGISVKTYAEKYFTEDSFNQEFAKLRDYWRHVINDNVLVETPNDQVNLWCNIRFKHLLHQTKRWTRGLDRGYRDILQDLRGFVIIDPSQVKKYLLKTLGYQYADGRALRQWSEIGGPHDFRDYSDSPVWIPDVLTHYIKETGDIDILEEEVSYYDEGSANVYEHMLAGLWQLFNSRGAHNLCLIRHGDWNDALEGIGKKGRAEGIWLTMALYWAMEQAAELSEYIQDTVNLEKLNAAREELKVLVNEHGWDGNWYFYAIDDDGVPVGSDANPEGKIHLNSQSFALMTGIAEGTRAQQCLDVIHTELDTKIGPLLVKPSYADYRVGRIWRMEKGTFENGTIYFHASAFKIMGDLAAGRADEALDSFLKILPSNPQNPSHISTIEPYALGNFYCGPDNESFGTNHFSHFTGSYSWFFKALVEKMIGVEATYEGLKITPCLPSEWGKVKVRKIYRNSIYDIEILRGGTRSGVYEVYADGVKLNASIVPLSSKPMEIKVVEL